MVPSRAPATPLERTAAPLLDALVLGRPLAALVGRANARRERRHRGHDTLAGAVVGEARR